MDFLSFKKKNEDKHNIGEFWKFIYKRLNLEQKCRLSSHWNIVFVTLSCILVVKVLPPLSLLISGLHTMVSLRTQSKCGNKRARKNQNTNTFHAVAAFRIFAIFLTNVQHISSTQINPFNQGRQIRYPATLLVSFVTIDNISWMYGVIVPKIRSLPMSHISCNYQCTQNLK